jgi:hypothetical protein
VSAGHPPPRPGSSRAAVSGRSIVLGLALIPPTAWWLAQVEYVRYSDTPTIPALFFHCVALLLLLTAANAVLARLRPRWALRREELIVVYSLQVIGSNLAGHDQLQILFTTIAWPGARATPENRWEELLLEHVPPYLLPARSALPALFSGHSSLYADGHWQAWLVPIAIWVAFVCVLAGTMFCLLTLLRRQWDHERLTYPLTEVPLGIVQPGQSMFRNPRFWIGFTLAAGLQLVQLASVFLPTLPQIRLTPRYYYFSGTPWHAFGPIPVCYYPFAVGLTFLLPVQLSFSVWFFFFVSRLQRVVAAAAGYNPYEDFPYIDQQSGGAYLAFALFVLWTARGHLAAAWRQAFRGKGTDDREEPLSYRAAFFGFGAGLLLLFVCLVAVGMRPWVAGSYLLLLFLIVLTVTRLRAEIGTPTIELYQRGADDILVRGLGAGALAPRELGAFSLLFFLTRTHRQFPMQHHADTLRLAERAHLDQRRFALAIGAATLLGAVCAFWALLHVTYQTGLMTARFTGPAGWAFGDEPWQRMTRWVTTPAPAKAGPNWAYFFGLGFTFLLVWLRARYLWWPLHPAGYVVSSSFALQRLWVPLMVSWLAKTIILRYGGLQGYRTALPFFIGLVLGEFSTGLLRTILDLSLGLYLPADSGIGGL